MVLLLKTLEPSIPQNRPSVKEAPSFPSGEKLLIDLPTELLLHIAACLSKRDVNSLAQTSSLLFRVYGDYLYRRDAVECSALLWAAKNNRIQTAKKAVAAGATAACPGVTGHCGWGEALEPAYTTSVSDCRGPMTLPCQALSLAVSNGSDDVVALLLQMPSVDVNHPEIAERTPIFDAISGGNDNTLKLLLGSDRVDPTRATMWLAPRLIYAVTHRYAAIVRVLIGYDKVDPDLACIRGRTALSYAVAMGEVEIAELLLSTGRVEPDRRDNRGWTPFTWAADNHQYDTLKLLLETGRVDSNARTYRGGWTPLNHAIAANWSWFGNAAIGLLVSHEAVDLNATTDNSTPLMHAALYGRRAQTEQIMSSGRVDPNATINGGMTALHIAARTYPEIVEVLLRYDAVDCNARCDDGFTPLAVAARYGNEAVVTMLLQSGKVADLNPRCGASAGTPLWWAAAGNHGAAADALLSHGGVDIDCKNGNGKTPLDAAREKGHKKVVRVLRRYKYRDRHVYPLPAKSWAFEGVETEGEGVLDALFSSGMD